MAFKMAILPFMGCSKILSEKRQISPKNGDICQKAPCISRGDVAQKSGKSVSMRYNFGCGMRRARVTM